MALRERLQAIASALEAQEAIPAIQAQMVLIQAVAGDVWWEGVTIALLEGTRKKLHALVKLIEKGKKNIVYTDFEDASTSATIHLPGISTGMHLAKFKGKARQFLKAHDRHLSSQRLRRNHPLTSSDIEALGKMLVQTGGTTQVLDEIRERAVA